MAKTKHATREQKATKDDHVSQVIGAVVDVQFPAGEQPELFEALEVTTGGGRVVVLGWFDLWSRAQDGRKRRVEVVGKAPMGHKY